MPAAAALSFIGDGRVLVVGGPIPAELGPAEHVRLEGPESIGALRERVAAARGPFDGVVIAGWGKGIELPELVRELCAPVRANGTVAFVAPVAQPGWRGARSAVLGVFRRRRPVPLERLAGALLSARLVDIRARRLDRPAGHAIVWARVPPRPRDAVESSEVRPSGR